MLDFAHADVVGELALMRLAAIEAFEGLAQRCVRLLASEVLFRELALAPVDLEALVKHALERFAEHAPIAIAVSEADAERVRAPLPIRVDPTLAAGDLVVEVRDGAFEARFAFRLEDALRRAGAT
jgi:flagellar biosynthesis/type III secretory pathway protein FliH